MQTLIELKLNSFINLREISGRFRLKPGMKAVFLIIVQLIYDLFNFRSLLHYTIDF